MRVKGSEWNALLKEGNTGWRRAQLLPYGLLPVLHQEPPAAGVQAPSEDTGRHLSAHLNRHCTKYNKKHQLNEPLKIYYSMMQSNTIYPMFQSGNIFCAVHVNLLQSVQVFICTYCSCVFLNAQYFSAVWTDKLDLSRHDFCWFTCLRFGYFCICIITLLCDSAFKHMLISSFLHRKVERCLTSLWFCVILYLLLLYFCIYAFVYFSVLVHWWVEWWQSGAARGLPLVLHCLSRSFDHHQITSLGLLFAQHVRRRMAMVMVMVTMYTTMLKVFENLVLYVWW